LKRAHIQTLPWAPVCIGTPVGIQTPARPIYLQWTMMGQSRSCISFTIFRKYIMADVVIGIPWSGQVTYCNCFTILCSCVAYNTQKIKLELLETHNFIVSSMLRFKVSLRKFWLNK